MSQDLDFMIRKKADITQAVERFGFLPFFTNSIPGFSIEEHTDPKIWFSDEAGPWEWKGPIIRESGCAYGKLFEKKAAFVSKKWFPDLANYRRDGYDFDSRFEDELASYQDKRLFELVDVNAPVLSKRIKELGNYKKGGNKGFDTCITRLQSQCYIVISDFVYLKDKKGKQYGWGVAEYSTPERFMGSDFKERVYSKSPKESYERILTHLRNLLPNVSEETLRKFLK